MATISTIGATGRTYSDPATWLASFAAGGWEGECYNDALFTTATSFTGHATSVTDYIILRCATGHSWRDNANVQTNAFAYGGTTNGVAFSAGAGVTLFTVAENFVTISGLQVQNTSTPIVLTNNTINLTSAIVENCIIEGASGTNPTVNWRSGLLRNNLIVKRTSTAIRAVTFPSGSTSPVVINCTVVRPSSFTLGADAFVGPVSGTITVENCAGFGFTNFATTGGATFTGSNNCSDATISFGTSNQASKTYANQFAVTTDTGRDFKLILGADCVDTGVTDTTNIPAAVDAAGTSRPQGSAWDIGAWELVVASGSTPVHRLPSLGVG
jgi:hypothetical protein